MNAKKILLCFLLSFCGVVTQAQENQRANANYVGVVSNVEYVVPMSERPEDVRPPDDRIREAMDKRSIDYLLSATPDPQSEDDYFVRNRHEMEQSQNRAPASLVFDAYASNSQPTDPSLAIGPNHVFVVFNTGFAIYDKNGGQLQGPTAPNPAIFPAGGCCDLTVSYDNAADRWVVSFLSTTAGAQIAVSDGPNPITAGWYVYTISAINDYQKLSVWRDGYYITDNTNSSNKVWALERSAMLSGDPGAQILGFNLPGIATNGFFSPQVLNVTDGNMPTTGGATVVYLQDNAWSGVSFDHIKYWTIDVDWGNTNNSSISAATEIATTPFISVFDNGSFSNLPQPFGGSAIDALQATIMNQAQFRQFSGYNSALFNFVVDADASSGELAAIRWYEFRQSGAGQPWSIYQEGTYTSPDAKHAWNASLAMDGQGNIGMGYTGMSSASSSTAVRVSSYFTGRLSTDPLGTMTSAETVIANGNGNFPGTRYGDYSKIDVDPSDDSSFWFINEYINGSRRGVVGKFAIQAGPPDNEPPTTPTNLVVSNISANGANLNWSASIDNVGVARYNVSVDGNLVGTSNSTSFSLTGLAPNTQYVASVQAEDGAGNLSGDVSANFATLGASYCGSASTNVNDEYISRVQLNTIDNSSGAQFYSDFTAISTNLNQGQQYTITVTPTWTGTIYNEGYAVWIDYNNDQDFEDAGELVWSKAPSTDTPNSGVFTVPSNTALAAVRMRVSMKYNGIPTSCETFTWGEVEDYTINLEADQGDTQPPTIPTGLNASNVTETTLDLSWNASTDNVGVAGYQVFINGSPIGTTVGTAAAISGLAASTTYTFQVRAFDAAGNNSALSASLDVTTPGGGGPGQIAGYFFETGFEGWSDGGSDCARVNNATRSYEGLYSIRLRDNTASSVTISPPLDLSGNGQISISFYVYSNSMEAGEDFFVEFWDGSSFQVIGNYARGVDFNNNAFFTDTIVLDAANYNFNSQNRFRFRCDASGNGDRLYFDQIIISGDNVRTNTVIEEIQETQVPVVTYAQKTQDLVRLYPNPASKLIYIELGEQQFDQILVYSMSGQLVKTVDPGQNELSIDVSEYASGMYFVRFIADGFATTKRFIKQ